MINILFIILLIIIYDYFNDIKKLLIAQSNKNIQPNIIIQKQPKQKSITSPTRKYINIRTRGEPSDYMQVGLLIHNEEILHLYGRQKYPGSTLWEYFAVGKDSNTNNAKFPINVNGDKEIEDGSNITLDYLNKTYKVKLYEYEDVRYLR
jgi:hypothetical protein